VARELSAVGGSRQQHRHTPVAVGRIGWSLPARLLSTLTCEPVAMAWRCCCRHRSY
jgi:hypothetical protein